MLNSKLTSITFAEERFDTAVEFDEYLNNISADIPNYTWYRRYAGCNIAHPIFSGVTYYIEGVKQSGNYEWQEIRSYFGDNTARWFFRVKNQGEWRPWMRVNVTTVG